MTTDENAPGRGGAEGAQDERSGGRVVMPSIRRPPVAYASLYDPADELAALIQRASELAQQISDQAERDRQSWDAGYREAAALFFAHGVSVGYAQAEEDMARAWRPVAEGVRRLGRSLTRDELELRRWDGRREDFGRPRPGDYTGGPVPWEGRGASA